MATVRTELQHWRVSAAPTPLCLNRICNRVAQIHVRCRSTAAQSNAARLHVDLIIYIYSDYGNEGGCECDNQCVGVRVNLRVNMSVMATASMRTRAHYDVGMSRSRSPFIQSIVKQSFCASSSYKYSVRDFNDWMRLLTIHIISHKPAV